MNDNGLVSSLLLSSGHLLHEVDHASARLRRSVLWPGQKLELTDLMGDLSSGLGGGGGGERKGTLKVTIVSGYFSEISINCPIFVN